jgi:glutamyl-tRNA synthetase
MDRDVPVFAHVPMILGPDGKRLSKRHGATAVGEYRNEGILADAMVNFLALLGWNPGTEQEVFTIDALIHAFSLENINRKSSVFDTKKLEWLNGQHIAMRSAADLTPVVTPGLIDAGLANAGDLVKNEAYLHAVIDLLKVRARVIDDIVRNATPFFVGEIGYDPAAVTKHGVDPETPARLAGLRHALEAVEQWDAAGIEAALRAEAERLGIAAGKLIHPLRLALLGVAVGPGVFDVAAVMGRSLTLARLAQAVTKLAP